MKNNTLDNNSTNYSNIRINFNEKRSSVNLERMNTNKLMTKETNSDKKKLINPLKIVYNHQKNKIK